MAAWQSYHVRGISIHALLAESDLIVVLLCHHISNFYPRSPCGERPGADEFMRFNAIFLSTLSLRRATHATIKTIQDNTISIHALLAESDNVYGCNWTTYHDFYPRSPCGERQRDNRYRGRVFEFLSTLSLRRATAKVHKTVGHFCAYETNFMGIASSC